MKSIFTPKLASSMIYNFVTMQVFLMKKSIGRKCFHNPYVENNNFVPKPIVAT
jgi:hypothetical protein